MLTNNTNYPFHLVDYGPWPLAGAIGAFILTSGLTKWYHTFNLDLFITGALISILTMIQWWRDITREGTFQGHHTLKVSFGLSWGMILFITSEIL